MATLRHRSQHRRDRQLEMRQQLITFRLGQEWFALPLLAVEKVVLLSEIQGNLKQTGSVAIYQGKSLLIINLNQPDSTSLVLPGEAATADKASSFANKHLTQGYLLIINSAVGLIGLPIYSPPALRRVTQSDFAPLPEAYVAQGNHRGVSAMVISDRNEPPLFLLDCDRLL